MTTGPSPGSRADNHCPNAADEPWWVAPARRRQTRLWLLLVAEGAFIVLVQGVITLIFRSHTSHRPHPGYLWLMFLPGLIFVTEGLLFLWLRRRGIPWAQPSPVMAVKGRARRQIMRAIRQGELPGGANRDLAVATARRLTEPNPGAKLFTIAAAGFAVAGILGPSARWVSLSLAAVFAITAVWLRWYLRRYQQRGAKYLALTSAMSAPSDVTNRQRPSGI